MHAIAMRKRKHVCVRAPAFSDSPARGRGHPYAFRPPQSPQPIPTTANSNGEPFCLGPKDEHQARPGVSVAALRQSTPVHPARHAQVHSFKPHFAASWRKNHGPNRAAAASIWKLEKRSRASPIDILGIRRRRCTIQGYWLARARGFARRARYTTASVPLSSCVLGRF